jgi:hypothetical protein
MSWVLGVAAGAPPSPFEHMAYGLVPPLSLPGRPLVQALRRARVSLRDVLPGPVTPRIRVKGVEACF